MALIEIDGLPTKKMVEIMDNKGFTGDFMVI